MDKKCPQCNTPLAEVSTKCPSCETDLKAKKSKKKALAKLTLGQRLAGVVLILNAVVLTVETMLIPGTDISSREIRGHIVSLIIGIGLAVGYAKVLPWAKFAVIAGAVVYTGLNIYQGDALLAGIQIAFSSGLILLLFGNPSRIRYAACAAVFLAYFAVESAGIQEELMGKSFITPYLVASNFDLESLENDVVNGFELPYRLTVSNSDWSQYKREEALKENPALDLWLINSKYNAHILTVAESDLGNLSLAEYVDNVLANGRAVSQNFTVKERRLLDTHENKGAFVDVVTDIDGSLFRFHYGIFTKDNYGFQIICYAFENVFENIKDDCHKTIASFTFDENTKKAGL